MTFDTNMVFDLRVKLDFAKNVQCYLKNVGFALLLPYMSNVACMTSAVLSRMK